MSMSWQVVELFLQYMACRLDRWLVSSRCFWIMLYMHLSMTFPTMLSRLMGLKFVMSVLSSFLWMGETFASFHIWEYLPVAREKLKIRDSDGAISDAVSFSILVLISSGPVALLGVRFCRISYSVLLAMFVFVSMVSGVLISGRS